MPDFYCDQVLKGKVAVEVVFETDRVLAFHHTHPYFEHHVVILPRQHITSVAAEEALDAGLAVDMMAAIHHVAAQLEKAHGGCRVSSNVGQYQSTPHLHWYVHAGDRLRNEDGSLIVHTNLRRS